VLLEGLKRLGLLPVFVPAPSEVFNEILKSPRLVSGNLGPTAFKATLGYFIAMGIAVSAGAKRCASATASPGGTIDRMKPACAASSSSVATGIAPAFSARAALAALRPASEVITVAPRSCRRRATPEPISPIAMTAIVSGIGIFLVFRGFSA